MTRPTPNQLFLGSFIHSKSLTELEYMHDAAVFVEGSSGKIVAIQRDCDRTRAEKDIFAKLSWDAAQVKVVETAAAKHEGNRFHFFFFPGFIDTHCHASQYPNNGIFGKSTLLDWLNTYTFPLEASLKDTAKAKRVYGRCVRKTLSHGTTTAAYYATIDVQSTNLLADICLDRGQRALVGRVCMDTDKSPAWYRDESAEAAVAATRACAAHCAAIDPAAALVRPVLTPRFAPSCSAELMRALGELAAATGLPVQTHLSENASEVELVASLFPAEFGRGGGAGGYAGVYDAFGLLTGRTILAHAVHLTEGEARLVRERGSKVAHCPCSNSSITSGAARVRWLLDRGVEVGLGTDMSGGYSPSILDAARQAALVSRHVAMGGDDAAKLSVEEVLFLATKGGAKVVGMEGRVGGFEVGMEWDAQLIGLGGVDEDGGPGEGEEESNVDVFGWESWEERIAKWLFNGDDRNTRKVWVRGRLVHERA